MICGTIKISLARSNNILHSYSAFSYGYNALLPILLARQKIVSIISLHLGRFATGQAYMPYQHLDCKFPTTGSYQMRSSQRSKLRLSILPRDTSTLAVAGLELTTLMV